MKKPIAIIEMGTPPQVVVESVGAQSQWFIDALGWQPEEYIICRPEHNDSLPAKDEISCAVISGSWSMVTDGIDWSERVADWIRFSVDVQLPLLGVCYGHQLMAYALGGDVADNPKGPEQGMHSLSVTDQAGRADALLAGFPETFPAWLCHHQTVTRLPQGAEILLRSEWDEHQMLRYNDRTYSVQFHPEFSKLIMSACYLAENIDDPELHNSLLSSYEPELAHKILQRFTQIFSSEN